MGKYKHDEYMSSVDFAFPRRLYMIQVYDIEMHLKPLIPWIAFASYRLISYDLKSKPTVGASNELGIEWSGHIPWKVMHFK